MAEGPSALVLGPAAKLGVEEPYKSLTSKVASSKNLEDLYDLLNQDLQRLLAIKEDKESQVQRHKQKHPTMVYRLWKKRVSDIATEVDNLRAEYERKRLPKWKFWRRSSLCEKVAKRHIRVKELIEEGLSISILVDHNYPEAVCEVLGAPELMECPALQNVLKEILSCLKNKEVKSVGVYGTKGVGKTTILQNLNNSEEVSQLFNMIIFTTVSADQNDKKLQQSIAKRLKVDIEATKDSIDEVARRIHEELKDKKFLLILDEVKNYLDLQQIGIPNDGNGSKVVMSSQHRFVCNENNMERLIEVKRLQHNEA